MSTPEEIRAAFPGVAMVRHKPYCMLNQPGDGAVRDCNCGAQRMVDRKVLEQIPPNLLSDAQKFRTKIRMLTEEVYRISAEASMSGNLDGKSLAETCGQLHGLIRDYEKMARKIDDKQIDLFNVPKGKRRKRT